MPSNALAEHAHPLATQHSIVACGMLKLTIIWLGSDIGKHPSAGSILGMVGDHQQAMQYDLQAWPMRSASMWITCSYVVVQCSVLLCTVLGPSLH